jgi:hypothetical protein
VRGVSSPGIPETCYTLSQLAYQAVRGVRKPHGIGVPPVGGFRFGLESAPGPVSGPFMTPFWAVFGGHWVRERALGSRDPSLPTHIIAASTLPDRLRCE